MKGERRGGGGGEGGEGRKWRGQFNEEHDKMHKKTNEHNYMYMDMHHILIQIVSSEM